MKVPLSWLSKYVQVPPLDELLPRVTEIGHMVDGLVRLPDGQCVVSLEVRTNRPDCLSILGIAREVAAAFGTPISTVQLADLPHEIHQSHAETPDYICFLRIKGARLDQLPAEMQAALAQYGQGTVTAFVDLANYVMVEQGQPLHVYDASKVDVASIQSRLGRVGESLALLNGETVQLSEHDLLIADRTGPLALAGVMGGDASKVVATSGDILVEVGNFRPELVRRTARRHGLLTEASQRCSKLLAPQYVPVALRRFLALLLQYGEAGTIELWQAGAAPAQRSVPIVLNHGDIERIAGVHIAPEQSVAILVSLGFTRVEHTQDGKIAALPPWWRTDVEHAADLIEEVLRIYGYSNIPLARLSSQPLSINPDSTWEQEEVVRNTLCAWGYDEVILDAFLADEAGGLAERRDVLRVENSPAANMDVLRPSLVPNMLNGARYLPFLIPERRLFEIGRTFYSVDGQPTEKRTVTWMTLMGSGPTSWHATGQPDFYSMKAEAEAMLESLGVTLYPEDSGSVSFPFLAGNSCCLRDRSGQVVGYVGEVDHQAYDLKPVRKSLAAEIYLPAPALRQATRQRTPRREVDSFDISVLARADTDVSAMQELVGEVLGQDLITVRLIDIYAGEQLDAGARSFTFRIVYARAHGEPRATWHEVGTRIMQQLHAEVRGLN